MKKLICFLLALALLSSLWACATVPVDETQGTEPPVSSAPPETDPPTETTEPSTEPPTETDPPETEPAPTEPERVSVDNQVDYTPEGEVVPNVVDAVNLSYMKYPDEIEYVCILPEIQLPGPNVEAINAEILADYKVFYEIPEGKEQPIANPSRKISYKWAVNGDILSIVILCGTHKDVSSIEAYGCTRTSVYNISISKCRLLSKEEVYAASGIEDVETRVLHAAAHHGGKFLLETTREWHFFENAVHKDWLVELFELNLSPENFEQAQPYFNEEGKLCVLAWTGTIGGAGYFWGDFCVEDYDTDALWTAEEYYEYYVEKASIT